MPTYNYFGGSSTYQELSFKDNYNNLGVNLNLSEFASNLSLGMIKEPSNIGDCSNVASKIILTLMIEFSDDQEEKNDIDPDYFSEVEI
jgi:hypothetical protein